MAGNRPDYGIDAPGVIALLGGGGTALVLGAILALAALSGGETVLDEDARALGLPPESVDCVVSNLCIHNLPSAADRERALDEIVRVLKPGGRAVLSDFVHTQAYARHLEKSAAPDRARRQTKAALTW